MAYRYSRDPEVERSLRYSVRDGVAWSLMYGAGESYLQAFAIFLKATTAQITLLSALPSLLGSIAQLASAWVAGRAIRRKSLIFAGVSLQSLAWLPIIALAFLPSDYSVALLHGGRLIDLGPPSRTVTPARLRAPLNKSIPR